MEKTMRFLSIAALALVGAVMTGCSSEDNFIGQAQQQVADKGNVVTVTATVGLGEQAGTRKLTIDGSKGVKTFAADDKIAVVYETSTGTTKVESDPITAGDISADGKTAKITITMTDPKAGGTLKYIYPAAMAGETDVDYTKLNTQDGTLDNLGKKFDLAVYDGNLTSEAKLPASATLENKLAILALTLKNSGSSDITSSITSLSIGDGTNTYSVTRSAAAGPIYVAIQPTSTATIGVNATAGTTHYYKELTSKTYAKDNGYSVTWKMAQGAHLSAIAADFTANNGDVLTGTPASNVKISIADGATVTLKDVNINGSGTWTSGSYAGITCEGDATITLEGTNTVKGFANGYPGIFVSSGKTLVINGTGELNASSNGSYSTGSGGAGIGAGNNMSCGNIEIQSGTVTATGNWGGAGIGGGKDANCGNITISGGTVTATGGQFAAGIGGGKRDFIGGGQCGNITISGGTITATGGENAAGIGGSKGRNNSNPSSCGTITITSGVTSVTATKGSSAEISIGAGSFGTCGTITIGGTEYPGGITTSPYEYSLPAATAYTLAESTVGMIVGSDGKAYAASDKNNLPSGVTVAGLVAYKNGNNGLAIALTDETSKMDWYSAMDDSGAKAHTPAVTGQTWKLPSYDDIEKMLSSYDNYWGDLNEAIANVGGTGLLDGSEDSYWLSDESDEESRYMIGLSSEEKTGPRDQYYLVRVVLAF